MSPSEEVEYDEWGTDRPQGPQLKDQSLNQLLEKGESDQDREKPYESIGIRYAPPGFRVMIRNVGRQYRASFSQVVRHALKLGATVLEADPRMRSLNRVLQEVRDKALEEGDPAALARLDKAYPFNFQRSDACHTTLSAIFWARGQLSELADVCGISVSQVAVIAVLAALYTLPNERAWKGLIREELDAFWVMVERRQKELLI